MVISTFHIALLYFYVILVSQDNNVYKDSKDIDNEGNDEKPTINKTTTTKTKTIETKTKKTMTKWTRITKKMAMKNNRNRQQKVDTDNKDNDKEF